LTASDADPRDSFFADHNAPERSGGAGQAQSLSRESADYVRNI
jgi:hypothetical protein